MRRLAPHRSWERRELPLTPPRRIKPRRAAACAHPGEPEEQLPRTPSDRTTPAPAPPPRSYSPARSSMGQCNCRKKHKDCQELTDVERAIETVINQFHCYAVKGQKEYLTPNEMQELVSQKLPHLGKCVGPLEEKIECMGDPNEAKLEFGEYWDMMGDAAKGCRRK
ncbi:protein S100-A14 [Patagioenas fasciata monilis]|uniref:Protein S100-A14 n=2 Tax=Patagioenas fasciata TaxID=372321 RepID=A0A1V4JZJ6_PATFA|nr:protein S100-A14 [Patagioenas fasciata monilis]